MIIKKQVDECRSAAEYVAANMPHGDGAVFHLLAWVAEHGEVALEHIDRGIDCGRADPDSSADRLMSEGLRIWLREQWFTWEFRNRAPESLPMETKS